jgi:hypothetical protein
MEHLPHSKTIGTTRSSTRPPFRATGLEFAYDNFALAFGWASLKEPTARKQRSPWLPIRDIEGNRRWPINIGTEGV